MIEGAGDRRTPRAAYPDGSGRAGGLAFVLVVVLLAGGSAAQVETRPPSAPRDAPLEQQLDALDLAVRDAAR